MKKGDTKVKYITVAVILLISIVLVILLNRQVPGLEKTKDILPRIGQEPVYVEMTEGEVLSATYTPARDMTVTSLKYLGILSTWVYTGSMAPKVVEAKQIHSTPFSASGTSLLIWHRAVTPVRLMPMERYMPLFPVSWLV